MKKLLAIIVLGLLFSGNAYAKVIELKKCSTSINPFDSKKHIKRSYLINTNKSVVQNVTVFTDAHYESERKKFMKEFGDARGWSKIRVTDFDIEYSDNRFVKASKYFTKKKSTLEIDIKKKTATFKINNKSKGAVWKCK